MAIEMIEEFSMAWKAGSPVSRALAAITAATVMVPMKIVPGVA